MLTSPPEINKVYVGVSISCVILQSMIISVQVNFSLVTVLLAFYIQLIDYPDMALPIL